MSKSNEGEGFGCIRCGSFSNWEVYNMLRSWQEDEKTFYAYQVICTKCGRPAEWITDDEKTVSERVKIRDELLGSDVPKFDSSKPQSSDLYGFDVSKVQPRLATGNQ